jgi:putative membrane protein
MTEPFARPIPPVPADEPPLRAPQAFAPATTAIVEHEPSFENEAAEPVIAPKQTNWLVRLAWSTGGLLVSLSLGLWVQHLVADLFAQFAWLGWLGLALAALFVLALIAIAVREVRAVMRLRHLGRLREEAAMVMIDDDPHSGRHVGRELLALYADRPATARARRDLEQHGLALPDGSEIVRYGERLLMAPLDAEARRLTAASARRVALVTTISPRALVDIAFVVYESIRLAGAIAALYGARPGLLGFWRLAGSILSHLAVTGGLVLTDGAIEQLVGQGLATRLSQRLGEGVVNGLMTVRVGITAMRIVRPLPFDTQAPPKVADFLPELVKIGQRQP